MNENNEDEVEALSGSDPFMSGRSKTKPRLLMDDDDEGDDNMDGMSLLQSTRLPAKKSRNANHRRRRRSSARFLHHLSGNKSASYGSDGDGGDEDDEDLQFNDDTAGDTLASTQNLNKLYTQAIRMNNENKINASNSWNLSLIDHLDRVAMSKGASNMVESSSSRTLDDSLVVGGVNFTKASCTLDASVKIYSYRVDDVHLSSYKVLANLNRTDHGGGANKQGSNNKTNNRSDHGGGDGNDDADDGESRGTSIRGNGRAKDGAGGGGGGSTGTLERNLANINLHKLDAAFDIDPLFHQVSKKFDEGGAKGLLLANLGVDINGGVRIVFDSTLDDEEAKVDNTEVELDARTSHTTVVQVASLQSKLESQLETSGHSSLNDLPLVPQLASLRLDHFHLSQEGFVDESYNNSVRYASSREEEQEADKSIHLEAIERSRASQVDLGGKSFLSLGSGGGGRASAGSFPSTGFEQDDFGAPPDFDDDDFIHDGIHRFSSASFQAVEGTISGMGTGEDRVASSVAHDPATGIVSSSNSITSQPRVVSQASVLLDAIASGDISATANGVGSSGYEYFDSQALETLIESSQNTLIGTNGNLWAGSQHWKKGKRTKQRSLVNAAKEGTEDSLTMPDKAASKKKKEGRTHRAPASSSSILVDISNPKEDLELLLQPLSGKSSGRGGTKQKKTTTVPKTYQWSQSAQAKHATFGNLLPQDAGMGVGELAKLFLRPKTSLSDLVSEKHETNAHEMNAALPVKTVGFGGVETWSSAEDSCGDDNGGLGFNFAGGDGDDSVGSHGSNNFVIAELDDVRKINKIQVGYATVAKKVDVKRLKKDLWTELDRALDMNNNTKEKDDNEEEEEKDLPLEASLSFQSVVADMQASQAQSDVTLPFYFICMLHLCNEKDLLLEACGLDDFFIHGSSNLPMIEAAMPEE